MSKPLEQNELKALIGQEVWLIPHFNLMGNKSALKEQISVDFVEKCGSKLNK